MIINMSGGGTGALLIRVVGGLTAPTNPKYATIWIQTDVPINGWEIFSGAPVWESAEGHVYLQDAPSTSGAIPNFSTINAAKKPYGFHWTRLVSARQRINGKWVNLNAYAWLGEGWTQFSSKFSATIHVTYPEGSTCTATDGVTTLTAPDTGGTWACVVPNSGTWTITATDGAKSKSASVTITTDGQAESVALSYTVSLYDHGDTCDSVTGGWEAVYNQSNGTTFGTDSVTLIPQGGGSVRAAAFTKNKIDLTPYSKIYVHHVSTIKRPSNYTCQRIDLFDQKSVIVTPIAYVSENRTENDWIQVMDVSEINTTCYVAIQCSGDSNESSLPKIVFDAVWMELR